MKITVRKEMQKNIVPTLIVTGDTSYVPFNITTKEASLSGTRTIACTPYKTASLAITGTYLTNILKACKKNVIL